MLSPAPAACFAQGQQARRDGDMLAAIAHFRETIRLKPDHVAAHNNLANALQASGDIAGALAICQQALVLAPDRAVLYCNLGSLWQLKGDLEQAISAYQHALARQPDFFLAHHNLAKAWSSQGQFALAESAYQNALRLRPDLADLHLDCGMLYHRYGFVPQALKRYRAALRLAPSARAYNSLGAALQDWGNLKLAQSSYQRALRLQPDFGLPQFNLAQLYENRGDLAAARTHYEQVLAMAPNQAKLHLHLAMVRRKQADWLADAMHMDTLRRAIQGHLKDPDSEPLPLLSALTLPLPPAWHRALAEQMGNHLTRLAEALASPFAFPADATPERLRIGYLSPDLRCHAVGTLIAELFQHHQRPEFEIFAYSLTPVQDDWTARIRAGCDQFLDVSLRSPLAIAQRIHADGIHILVDLAGYTTHSRPLVLALRPAPVQLHYLGYPGTLGAGFTPYILADRQLIPETAAALYAERIIYLPHAWGTTPMTIADSRDNRADCGLPEQGTVYCCFNGIHKIDPEVFALWMDILRQVPDSVLWLSVSARRPGARQAADRHHHPGRDCRARPVSIGTHPRHRQSRRARPDGLPCRFRRTDSQPGRRGIPSADRATEGQISDQHHAFPALSRCAVPRPGEHLRDRHRQRLGRAPPGAPGAATADHLFFWTCAGTH